MKKTTTSLNLFLALFIFASTLILPASATVQASATPRYEARPCYYCESTNTSFLGYNYLFTDYDHSTDTYKVVYYDANYKCNSCGGYFSYVHIEKVPIS